MALGAQRSAVQAMILREGAAMLATGIGFGLLLALATGRIISSMLYEVSSLDPSRSRSHRWCSPQLVCWRPGSLRVAPHASTPWPHCGPNSL
jgi:ABC-type antimicrobial peptide transport system permease subunit